ncbi:hypothetical protein FNV43_RR13396 [Rhamnella rubrinervis]|uniref:RNase H type-1 domain-containing protein n=1 Tax=Rhamnella rubrinervis TaxID=2594499 RepID=A0A8K0MF51_9ROSA|nr:hypothetical protein FNV43_RR13396 [Rhamnella rubrinervis]
MLTSRILKGVCQELDSTVCQFCTKEVVWKGSCFKLGDGRAVNLWKHPQVPWLENKVPIKRDRSGDSMYMTMVDLQMNYGRWNEKLLRELFNSHSSVELMDHIVYSCHIIRVITFGSKWGINWDGLNRHDPFTLIGFCLDPKGFENVGNKVKISHILILTIAWRFHNDVIFRGTKDIKEALYYFDSAVEEYEKPFELEQDSVHIIEEPSFPFPTNFPEDALFINTDATVGSDKITLSMIVRDVRGKLVFLASSLYDVLPPYLAEMKALEWATGLATQKNWTKVFWFSDSQYLVQEINSNRVSSSWFVFNEILNIKCEFAEIHDFVEIRSSTKEIHDLGFTGFYRDPRFYRDEELCERDPRS